MNEYLPTNWLKLSSKKLDAMKDLKEPILSGSTSQSDWNTDCQTGIGLRTTRKKLNRSRYKSKKVQKDESFYRHQRENLMECKDIILYKIKLLIFYFVKFLDDTSMLLKIYLENYTISHINQNLIIMIMYDKKIFSTNHSWWKI